MDRNITASRSLQPSGCLAHCPVLVSRIHAEDSLRSERKFCRYDVVSVNISELGELISRRVSILDSLISLAELRKSIRSCYPSRTSNCPKETNNIFERGEKHSRKPKKVVSMQSVNASMHCGGRDTFSVAEGRANKKRLRRSVMIWNRTNKRAGVQHGFISKDHKLAAPVAED